MKSRRSLVLFSSVLTVSIFGLLTFNSESASASCGVESNNPHDYAGLIVDVLYKPYGEESRNENSSNPNTKIQVATEGYTTTPPGGLMNLDAKNRPDSESHHASRIFKQSGLGCDFYNKSGAMGDSTNVVLGTGGSSTDTINGLSNWALDCDVSKREILKKSDPSVNLYQRYKITPIGMPSGAHNYPGSHWEVKIVGGLDDGESYADGGTTAIVAPPNGTTKYVQFTWVEGKEPEKPKDPDPEKADCNTYRHRLTAHSNYRFTVYPNNVPRSGAKGAVEGTKYKDMGSWANFQNFQLQQNFSNTEDIKQNISFGLPDPIADGYIVEIENWQHVTDKDGKKHWEYSTGYTPISGCRSGDIKDKDQAVCSGIKIYALSKPSDADSAFVNANSRFDIVGYVENTSTGVGARPMPITVKVVDGDGMAGTEHTTGELSPGANGQFYMSMYSMNDISRRTVWLEPQYNGLPIGQRCSFIVDTYQDFRTDITGGIGFFDNNNATDYENPWHIKGSATLTGKGTAAGPVVNATLKLFRNGTQVGSTDVKSGSPGTIDLNNSFDVNDGVRSLGWNAGDKICAVLEPFNYSDGWVGPSGKVAGGRASQRQQWCNIITNMPYVSVFTNDVSVGGGGLGETCGSGGSIKTYAKNAGSGTQLAALANGDISGFKSIFLKNSGTPLTPNGLTAKNYSSVDCAPNYFVDDQFDKNDSRRQESTASSIGIAELSARNNGQTVITPVGGKLTLSGGTFSGHHSLFVDGDVYITGSIAYANAGSGWFSIEDIPYFNLVVKGNIYIDPGVTQLDGRYIAQPKNDSSRGEIYTCAPGGSAPTGSAFWDNCRSQLQINGQFVSKKVHFYRTGNTISNGVAGEYPYDASKRPKSAEVFNFSPEMYLARPAVKPKSTASSGESQSVSTLPPIL